MRTLYPEAQFAYGFPSQRHFDLGIKLRLYAPADAMAQLTWKPVRPARHLLTMTRSIHNVMTGTDMHKLWLRSEGERVRGHTESADVEVLYGHPVSRWWDVVAGVRHDIAPGADQDFAAIGVTGMAPYKFEIEATAYIGTSGQTTARVEAEYELLLTNRLILQPLVEAQWHGKDDRSRGIGSGLGKVEAGLRLRYEVTRKFAPYVGLVHERSFGGTADLRRDEGEPTEDTRVIAGVRLWF
jgi:copper resistance protein B